MGSTKGKVWSEWILGDGEYKREGLKEMNNGVTLTSNWEWITGQGKL